MPLTTINTLNKTSIKITHIINTIDKIRLHKSISSKMFNDVKGDVEYIKDNVVFYNKILIYEDPHDDYSLIDKLISLINEEPKNKFNSRLINLIITHKGPAINDQVFPDKQLFDTGIDKIIDYQTKDVDKHERLRETVTPLNPSHSIGLYIYCHGESVYTLSNEFKTFSPIIEILKYTAASLCETFISTSMQDKYGVLFIIILYNYYYQSYGINLFDNPIHSILLANYITCELYGEYKDLCTQHGYYKNISETDRAGLDVMANTFTQVLTKYITENPQLYTYPISNPARHAEYATFPKLINRIKTDVKHEEILIHPCRVSYSSISAPKCNQPEDTISYVQRDKYYSVEDEIETPTTLDIKILNSFTFGFGENLYAVVAGDSLLELLLKLNTENATAMNELKRQYTAYRKGERKEGDPEVIIDNRECDFDKCTMISSITVGIKETITSISLQFLLFFLEYIGVKKTTVYDFSCGCPANTDEGETKPSIVSALQARGPTQSQVTLSPAFSQTQGHTQSQVTQSQVTQSQVTQSQGLSQAEEEEEEEEKMVSGGAPSKMTRFYSKNTHRRKNKNKNKSKNKSKNRTKKHHKRKTKNRKNKSQRRRNK